MMFQAAIAELLIADIAPQRSRQRPEAEPIGTHPLRGGVFACGVGLAFGHADAAALERLAGAASDAGASGFRTAPGRALTIIGLASPSLPSFTAAAAELGFVVSADDPRRHVFACAGAPICSSAHIAARAIAQRITEAAAPYLNASFQIHLSGCAKGCAHAGGAALTIVGAPRRCGLIANGCVRDIPFDTVPPEELPAAIVRYARETKREVSHV
jgi:precorrin-3B synthase